MKWNLKASLVGLRKLTAVVVLAFCSLTCRAQNVIAWGNNTSGQTNVPAYATNVIAVAAGYQHSVALREDGTVIAWGNAAYTNVPPEATNVVSIAAGPQFSLALRGDGSIVSWGTTTLTNVPVEASNAIAIAIGENGLGIFNCMVLRSDGTVFSWPSNSEAGIAPGDLSNVVAIAAGPEHQLALLKDGSAWNWNAGRKIKGFVFPSAINVIKIAAAYGYDFALCADGSIHTWNYPVRSIPKAATNVVDLVYGTNCILALKADGKLVAWGTGNSTNIPTTASNIISISVGVNFGLAVKGDGKPRMLGSISYNSQGLSGSPLPLYVRAVGQGSLAYQWLADGVPVPGATNPATSIIGRLGSDDVAYQVVVSNSLGSITSSIAKVSIKPVNVWGDVRLGQCRVPESIIHPVAVSAGPFHSLAVQPTGSVVGWGRNWDGQATVPDSATNVIAVAAGSYHSLALRSDGSVVAWGRNSDGQATVPAAATNVVAISAGQFHSVALRADGSVVAWGNNDYGQLAVSFLANHVVAISAGYLHTLALRADGTVFCWGNQTNDVVPQVTAPAAATNVVAIAAGWRHDLALRADGTIVSWGDNTYGQAAVPAAATNVVAISAGWYHSMALRADGKVFVWGKGVFGVTNVPVGLTNIASIDVGEDFCLVVEQSGPPQVAQSLVTLAANQGGQTFFNPNVQGALPQTFQWTHNGILISEATNRFLLLKNTYESDAGNYELILSNAYGMTTNLVLALDVLPTIANTAAVGGWGDDYYNQREVLPGITDPVAIAAGGFHNLVLQSDGTVVSWGKNLRGQTNVPPSATNIVAVAAGNDHSLALRNDGSVIAWGKNWEGQTNVPVTVSNAMGISAGWGHSLALLSNGTVVAWGNNDYGQTNVPINLTGVVAVAAGYYHNLALCSDQKLVSWGSQDIVPAAATNVVAMAAGWEHNLALRADGRIVAWGDNYYGQCSVPASATNVIAVAAGYGHSMALLADGRVLAWGKKWFSITNVPAGLFNATRIACGEDFDLALVNYGIPRASFQTQPPNPHVGDSMLLAAALGGTFPQSLQWYQDSIPLADATNRWLKLDHAQLTNSGEYVLVASNAAGVMPVLTNDLLVHPEPIFFPTLGPQVNGLVGTPLCLTVPVGGASPMSFQFQLNGVDLVDGARITGATTPSICFSPASFQDSGALTLIVTNDYGSFTGLVANVAITPIISWGDNGDGQFYVPPQVTNVTSISQGRDHYLALGDNGVVAAWGDNYTGQNSLPTNAANVVAVAEGETSSTWLKNDGTLAIWGDNAEHFFNPATIQDAVQIAAGNGYSLALLANGTVASWSVIGNTPFRGATNVLQIAARGDNMIGLCADGTLLQGGNSVAIPARATNVLALAPAKFDTLVLRSDGTVVAWGLNRSGQTNIPVAATNVVSIAAGDDHFVALRGDGSIVAWGSTNFGQCAISAPGLTFESIAASSVNTLAIVGQPWNRTLLPGGSARFTAGKLARRLAEYQWQLNGADLVGETNAVLDLKNIFATNAGTYQVVVNYGVGSLTSPPMNLAVQPVLLVLDVPNVSPQITNSAVKLRLAGSTGINPVTIYASSNLLDWTPIFTNPPTTNPIDFVDLPSADMPLRFYRGIEQP